MPGRVVTPEEWRTARLELLAKEKQLTRQSDELAKLRNNMPMVKVTQDYTLTGANGKVSLADIFEGRRQLIVDHMMYDPSWDSACKSCSFALDHLPQHLGHLHSRNTTLAVIARAPYEKLAAFKDRMGWPFPIYSSYGSDFNYDYHVTQDESVRPIEYDYKDKATLDAKGEKHFMKGEQPGCSVFMLDCGEVFHSYSTYARGGDQFLTTYALLDMTPLGRQDSRIQSDGLGFKYHDEY